MARAMFSSDVVGTDLFLETLSDEAQLLYYRLGSEGTYGKIAGIQRIARGYGASRDALQELYDLGYLFDFGGCAWVRHYWVNNIFKTPNNDFALTMPEISSGQLASKSKDKEPKEYGSASGGIGFEGDPFKSAFVPVDTNKAYLSHDRGCSYQVQEQEQGQEQGQEHEQLHGQDQEQAHRKGHMGEPTDLPPCPACGQLHFPEGEEGIERMRCPGTGRTYWLEDGEWR